MSAPSKRRLHGYAPQIRGLDDLPYAIAEYIERGIGEAHDYFAVLALAVLDGDRAEIAAAAHKIAAWADPVAQRRARAKAVSA